MAESEDTHFAGPGQWYARAARAERPRRFRAEDAFEGVPDLGKQAKKIARRELGGKSGDPK